VIAACEPELRASLTPRTRRSVAASRWMTANVSSREWSSTISHSQSTSSRDMVLTTRS
jgi:hypothetical protein